MKCLIVGHGLSGSILAWTLRQAGFDVTVADPGASQSASSISAGVVNAVTGKRWTLSWRFKEMHRALLYRYQTLETSWGMSFYHTKPLIRLFHDAEDVLTWQEQKSASPYPEYFGEQRVPGLSPAIIDPYGSVCIEHCGMLDTAAFLNASRERLTAEHCLISESVNSRDIKPASDHAVWKGRRFDRIIFCEGYRAKDNLWFPGLSLAPARGDILTLRSFEEMPSLPDAIIVGRQWLVPLGGQRYKAGSNYIWDHLEAAPDERHRREILDNIRKFCRTPFSVLQHQCGVRPASSDRKPLIGFSPLHPSLAVFNGFGSKGVLQIPYCAEYFRDVMLGKKAPDPEMDIQRFKKKISSSS